MNGQESSEKVLMALRQINRAMDVRSRALVQEFGLTIPQLVLLRALHSMGELSAGQLARYISASAATVTGVLSRLEKRDLVVRTRSHTDKRRIAVDLTEEGRRLLQKAPSLFHRQFADRFAGLEPWEQSLLLSSVQRIVSMMEADQFRDEPEEEGNARAQEVNEVAGATSGAGHE